MDKYLIIDMKNVAYKYFHTGKKTVSDLTESVIKDIAYFKNLYKPNKIICAFDGESWRKEYTNSPECLSYKKYKSNRNKNMSDEDIMYKKNFDTFNDIFYNLLLNHTKIIALRGDNLEADDLIARMCEILHDDVKIIVSNDQDLLQIQRIPNTHQVASSSIVKKQLDLSEYDYDPDYFLFSKIIRGDAGDFVMSARPRIRQTAIKKAYHDELLLTNLKEHKFTVEFIDSKSGELMTREYTTKDVMVENKLLMDLFNQPEHIRNCIDEVIDAEILSKKKYDKYAVLKHLRCLNVLSIEKYIDSYDDLFLNRQS